MPVHLLREPGGREVYMEGSTVRDRHSLQRKGSPVRAYKHSRTRRAAKARRRGRERACVKMLGDGQACITGNYSCEAEQQLKSYAGHENRHGVVLQLAASGTGTECSAPLHS